MSSRPGTINPRILILFMVVGLLPLGVGSIILLNSARDNHQDEIARLLSSLADSAQMALNNYLQNQIVEVAAIATVPEVRDQVFRSNPSEVTAAQEQIESDWDQLDANESPLLVSILQNPASRFLRDFAAVAPALREIFVTDVHGRVVAATNKTSDYFQADERWWQHAYRQGTGGHYLSDVLFDQSVGSYAIEVAEPVMDPETNTAIGVLKAALDGQEIVGLVNSVDSGDYGNTVLMRGDGTVIVSRRPQPPGDEFPYAEQVVAASSASRNWIEVGSDQGRAVIGLARARLKDTYPELDWYLMVERPHSSEIGAFASMNLNFLYIVIFSVLVVLILSWVFSKVLSRPIIETDPHLEQL